jgi:hypothetical protein
MRNSELFGQFPQEPLHLYVVFNKIKLYRPEELLISSGEALVRGYIQGQTNEQEIKQ